MGMIVALAACSAPGAGSSPSGAMDDGSHGPARSAPGSPTALGHFADDLVAFDLPAGWHERVGRIIPSGNWPIVFVGPADLLSECTTNPDGSGECRPWPVIHLTMNGSWRANAYNG
jgi:hypothetical protein